ncbi:hypothetical protein [Parvibaculum sp.]|uniref:hypothetical protein n=1 Tax=Parvibaculum sp. TaxID=2024848 RepID=UPI003918AB91
MSNGAKRIVSTEPKDTDQFVVDEAYLRKQASEAVMLFLVPFSGIFNALRGGKARNKAA